MRSSLECDGYWYNYVLSGGYFVGLNKNLFYDYVEYLLVILYCV